MRNCSGGEEKVFLTALFIASPDTSQVQVAVSEARVELGLNASIWLPQNHTSWATSMAKMFQQLEPEARGRGRVHLNFTIGISRFCTVVQ